MGENPRPDLTLNGGGSVAAGTYESLQINGHGNVTGDIICTNLQVNGIATCSGTVRAGQIGVNGTATFHSPVQVSQLTVNGDASVRAGLGVGELTVRGSLTVDGSVAARTIEVKGALRVRGDITAESLRGEGVLEGGAMDVGELDFAAYGASKATSVESRRVTLRSPGSLADVLMFFTEKRFTAQTVRASEVWAENLTANIVSAGNATIGAGCAIGLVHYSGTYSQVGDARVTEARKA